MHTNKPTVAPPYLTNSCTVAFSLGHGHFVELLAVTSYPGLILDNNQMKHAAVTYLEPGDDTGNGVVVERYHDTEPKREMEHHVFKRGFCY